MGNMISNFCKSAAFGLVALAIGGNAAQAAVGEEFVSHRVAQSPTGNEAERKQCVHVPETQNRTNWR